MIKPVVAVVIGVAACSTLAGSAQAAFTSRSVTSPTTAAVKPSVTVDRPAWSVVASPDSGRGSNELISVSCVSPTACAAVGYYTVGTSGMTRSLVESWHGKSWKVVPSPEAGHSGDVLRAVSCNDFRCVAVGNYGESSGAVVSFAQLWGTGEGTDRFTTRNPSTTYNGLSGISCPATNRCVAVGESQVNKVNETLVETWNGKSWFLVSSPNVGTRGSVLHSVSCSSTDRCVAVGSYQTASNETEALVETWDGKNWFVSKTPNEQDDTLSSVSCSGPKLCMAVGNNFASGRSGPFSEMWNGRSWSTVSTPGYKSSVVFLDGVSCSSPTSCMAVGSSSQTLVETWNGEKWYLSTSATKGDGGSFETVSCADPNKCVAAGTYDQDAESSGFVTKSLIESK